MGTSGCVGGSRTQRPSYSIGFLASAAQALIALLPFYFPLLFCLSFSTGTNDGSQSPPAVFTASYLALLEHLASHATSRAAPIFVSWGPNSALPAPWITAAANQATALGMNVTAVDMMAAELDGCGHPGVLGHPHMARIGAPIVAGVTGWSFDPSLL